MTTVADCFELHRHRFASPHNLQLSLVDARDALNRSDVDALEKALPLLRHAPFDSELYRALARYYVRAGDVPGAQTYLEVWIDLEGPTAHQLLDELAPSGLLRAAVVGAIEKAQNSSTRRCRSDDIHFCELQPELEDFSLVLRWPKHHHERVQEAVDRLVAHCARIEREWEGNRVDENPLSADVFRPEMESPFQCQADVSCALTPSIWGHVGMVIQTFEAIASYVEDVRFFAFIDGREFYECWIVDGDFYLSVAVCPLYISSIAGQAEYLSFIYESVEGADLALREHLLDLWGQTFPLPLDVWSPVDESLVPEAEQAIERLRSLGEEPDFLVARLEQARGNLPAAAVALRRVARSNHDVGHHVWRELARIQLELQDFDDALLWAERASNAGYNDDSRLLAALAALGLEDRTLFLSWIDHYVEKRGLSSPGVLLRDAKALLKSGEREGAQRLFEALVPNPRYEKRARAGLAECSPSTKEPAKSEP